MAKDWAQQVYKLLDPYKCDGTTHAADEISINRPLHIFMSEDHRKEAAYTDWVSEQRLIKLAKLKAKFDPTNFFSENLNIMPGSNDNTPHI